jgi:cobalt/nickel transport system permease protein
VRRVVIVPFLVAALIVPLVATDAGAGTTQLLGRDVPIDGLLGAWNVAAKASLGVVTSIVLTATTETPRLLRGLDRLRVPQVLTQIATFMVRYLEVVAGELGRQRTAMVARGHDPRWLWQVKPLTASIGSLFVRSYERGERVHAAMLARGYDGTMPALDEERVTPAEWLAAAALPLIAATGLALTWTVL